MCSSIYCSFLLLIVPTKLKWTFDFVDYSDYGMPSIFITLSIKNVDEMSSDIEYIRSARGEDHGRHSIFML